MNATKSKELDTTSVSKFAEQTRRSRMLSRRRMRNGDSMMLSKNSLKNSTLDCERLSAKLTRLKRKRPEFKGSNARSSATSTRPMRL